MTGYPSHLDSWRLPALIPRRETCLWTIYIACNISKTFRFLAVLATKAPNYILRHWKGRNPRGFLACTLQFLGNSFCYIHCCCRDLSILTYFTSSLVSNAERGWEADLSVKIKGNSNSLFQSWFAIRVPAECPILNVDVLCANCKLRAHGATGVGLTLLTLP